MPSAKLGSVESVAPFAGWLPPLMLASEPSNRTSSAHEGCWLPIRTESVPPLVAILHQPDPRSMAADRLGAALKNDPGLLIHTAALWVSNQPIAPEIVQTEDLIQWWCDHGVGRFADDNVLRSEPTTIWPRMRQLDQYFRTLPRSRWLRQSAMWFDASGDSHRADWLDRLQSLRWQDETPDIHNRADIHNRDSSLRQTFHLVARRLRSNIAMESQWKQRVQENRLELAKNLAYGLSHEINNPLAAIVTRAESLRNQSSDPAMEASLNRIIQQSYRAHAMIADLMFFAHPTLPERSRFCLHEKIQQVLLPLHDELARLQIEVDLEIKPSIHLLADADMIGDAIMSVLRNAIDAIGTQGRIRVSAEAETNECSITIADSGPGMNPEDARRAFDPYFSGREAGRGLGLGLCRVERIVELHGGRVGLTTGTAGCTIHLKLPIDDPLSRAEPVH